MNNSCVWSIRILLFSRETIKAFKFKINFCSNEQILNWKSRTFLCDFSPRKESHSSYFERKGFVFFDAHNKKKVCYFEVERKSFGESIFFLPSLIFFCESSLATEKTWHNFDVYKSELPCEFSQATIRIGRTCHYLIIITIISVNNSWNVPFMTSFNSFISIIDLLKINFNLQTIFRKFSQRNFPPAKRNNKGREKCQDVNPRVSTQCDFLPRRWRQWCDSSS